MRHATSLVVGSLFCPVLMPAQGTRLLRHPTVSSTQVAFTHAGDIWVASRDGGDAKRLTSFSGTESNPRYAPDGKRIAFSMQYGGFMIIAARGAVAQGRDSGLARLEQEIGRLAPLAGGTVGVAAVHVESGREVYFNRGVPFPMASTYKVPIAAQLLTRVDRGELQLDSLIALTPADLHPGSGTLTELFDDPGVILSLRNLLELMLLISDNSATDIVLRTAGGPADVTARMRALGFAGIRVDRPTAQLIADWVGIKEIPLVRPNTPRQFADLFEQVPDSERAAAERRFNDDPRDTATPEAMARLLTRIWHKEILRPETSDLLLDIMLRSTTGVDRIKGLLPPETPVSHKTGTIGSTTNDAGIVTLPGDAGHVVMVVFVKASDKAIPERERAIAHIARTIHDYFLFNPAR